MPQARVTALPLDPSTITAIMPMLNTLVVKAGSRKRRWAWSSPVSSPDMPIKATATVMIRSILAALAASAGVAMLSVAIKRLIGPANSQIAPPITASAASSRVRTVLISRHRLGWSSCST
jgi:hypothetical protein